MGLTANRELPEGSDLTEVVEQDSVGEPLLTAIRRVEALCGQELTRRAMAEIGWAGMDLGLTAERYVGIAIDDSLPFMVPAAEAPLLECCDGAQRVSELVLIVGHGGRTVDASDSIRDEHLVTRFRRYNLAHAELLERIVDPTPLTRERSTKILESMDRIVDDFVALFASRTEECAILPDVYGTLKQRILAEAERDTGPNATAEMSRLVQTFDDPASLGAVQTVHGLKRYLHQRGLELGMQLVKGARAADRTVSLVLTSNTQILRCIKRIRYADFDPEDATGTGDTAIPWPVRMAVDAYGRQLLHGTEKFPHLEIFCYGNEVHYYLSFWNHPAFLRVDFSPPLRGGMIDLAYYGVSNYDEAVHPDPSLYAVQELLRRVDFDVHVDCSRIHARFDKEQSLDPARLRERVDAALRLAPYLMDLDWTIGSLALDAKARRKVSVAWAETFRLWGVLPMYGLLTKDRRGILVTIEKDPHGESKTIWSGEGPYRDRFAPPPTEDRFDKALASLQRLGVETPCRLDERQRMGQIALEQRLLHPLREAAAQGAISLTTGGIQRAPASLYETEHAVERFARILIRRPEELADYVRAARLLPVLSATVRFETTGTLNGYEIQQARIDLWGHVLSVYALADSTGIARLAFFAHGNSLNRREVRGGGPWRPGATCATADVAALLCRANYLNPGAELTAGVDRRETAELRELFGRQNPRPRACAADGRRLLHGLPTARGRAAGRVLFGTEGRTPEQCDDAILVAPTVRPEDNTFIYRSSGVVTTGGGILSHAGLLAVQFGKPALIISGRWHRDERRSTVLLFTIQEHHEEERLFQGSRIRVRRAVCEREHRLHEGDLVVLDADEGTLQVLGQDQTTLALHEELKRLAEISRRRLQTTSDRQRLNLRGERLRTERQVSRLLERLTAADVARYAVRELLLGSILFSGAEDDDQRARLLVCALHNRATGADSRECLLKAIDDLSHRDLTASNEALRRVRSSRSLFEILSLRLDALNARRSVGDGFATLEACGIERPRHVAGQPQDIDGIVRSRLRALRDACATEIQGAAGRAAAFRLRHLLRQLDRLDLVLRTPAARREPLRRIRAGLDADDDLACRKSVHRRVLADDECGFESFPLIGWKAANLAEIARLCGGRLVPPWFAVTQRAFEEALDSPVRAIASAAEGDSSRTRTLRESIEATLGREAWSLDRKSRRIRLLWEHLDLSPELASDLVSAYRQLVGDTSAGADDTDDADWGFVAIRSSSVEEDAEAAARAGEFETFLFVRGQASLIAHVKRAWSGLWTERAIHNRAALGSPEPGPGGGIIVQRIVKARVAGVLQTVNVGRGASNEIVVNAGLGLGEGVVSGVVMADQFTVAKNGNVDNGPLRFRCVTADKAERIVFNRRLGTGTVRQPTPRGERLRPALEHDELQDLVLVSLDLERAYGYPLDIEFAYEGSRLWILQARPVVTYLSTLRETLDRWPLGETTTHERYATSREVGHDPA